MMMMMMMMVRMMMMMMMMMMMVRIMMMMMILAAATLSVIPQCQTQNGHPVEQTVCLLGYRRGQRIFDRAPVSVTGFDDMGKSP